MMTMPADPAARDFAIDRLLDDLAAGRAERRDADLLRAELRMIGDLGRLERVARSLAARG